MPVAPTGAAPPAPGAAPAAAPPARFAAALERRAAPTAIPTNPPAVRPEPLGELGAGSAPAEAGARSRRAPAAHPALAALARIERAQARLDGVLAAARAGRTFTAAELLGLQAEAYRCTQTVDLAAKLVEQSAQAVKQALNTQL